jgi:hypothetical protein
VDIAPRALSRWLPWLGFALAIEGFLGFGSWFLGSELSRTTFFDIPYLCWILVFGIVVNRRTREHPERDACRSMLYGGLVAVLGTALDAFSALYFDSDRHPGLFPHALGMLGVAVAAPGLLGAALARRVDPAAVHLPWVARISGISSLVGFSFLFISESLRVLLYKRAIFSALTPDGSEVLYSIVLLSSRGCLLGATLLSLRPIPGDTGLRQTLIIRTMTVWALATAVAVIVACSYGFLSSGGGYGYDWKEYLWRGLIELTLFPSVAILLALTLEKPGLGYKSWRNRNSQGGAEA